MINSSVAVRLLVDADKLRAPLATLANPANYPLTHYITLLLSYISSHTS